MKLADVIVRIEQELESWVMEVDGRARCEEDNDPLRLLGPEEVNQIGQLL
jgi:hypothetical protein